MDASSVAGCGVVE